MVAAEQLSRGAPRRMSGVLWDVFTGSAPYGDVFRRTLHPMFLAHFCRGIATGFLCNRSKVESREDLMEVGELGRVYRAGEVIVRQGDRGECMYVIQSGKVEVCRENGGKEVRLAELGEGDLFGEMALFDQDVRSATVRPCGEVRVLTVDKKMFLRKIHEDPSLAFRVIQKKMSRRIRELDEQLARLAPAAARAAIAWSMPLKIRRCTGEVKYQYALPSKPQVGG